MLPVINAAGTSLLVHNDIDTEIYVQTKAGTFLNATNNSANSLFVQNKTGDNLNVNIAAVNDTLPVQITGTDVSLPVDNAYVVSSLLTTRGGSRTTPFTTAEIALNGGRGLRVIVNTVALAATQTLTVKIEFSYFDSLIPNTFYTEYTSAVIAATGTKRIVISPGVTTLVTTGYESFPDILAGSCKITVTPSNGAITYDASVFVEQM